MKQNENMIQLIQILQMKLDIFSELYNELDKYKMAFQNANEFYEKIFKEDYLQEIQDNFIN